MTACRPVPGQNVKRILSFEVLSSTEWKISNAFGPFVPNWFVNISDHIDVKLEALMVYKSEVKPWPHARSKQSVKHLARLRGAMVGVQAAEAFMLQRQIQ